MSSSRTKRFVSLALAMIVLIAGVVFGTQNSTRNGSIPRHRMSIEHVKNSATKHTNPPKTTPSEGGKPSKDNYFPKLKSGYEKNHPYAIAVNTAQNVVTVYKRDSRTGKYTVPYKAFICSTGKQGGTRSGTWYTSEKCGHWHALVGNVQGQWATRIHDSILFHSVPYYKADPSTLETEEYNKLGTVASAGCVRMTVADVKWIYDNCPLGTCVTIYNDGSVKEPLGKPSFRRITVTSSDPRYSWDPTDPDARNPWH